MMTTEIDEQEGEGWKYYLQVFAIGGGLALASYAYLFCCAFILYGAAE